MVGDANRSNKSELDEMMFTNIGAFQNNLHNLLYVITYTQQICAEKMLSYKL